MKYTYLFKSAFTGLTKIGRTGNPYQRFSGFRRYLKLEVVAVICCDCEHDLHKKHEAVRDNGEWFNLSDEVLAEYKSKYSQELINPFRQSQTAA